MVATVSPQLQDRLTTWFSQRRWSEADYLLFANDQNALVELADGKVVLQEMPTPRHQAAVVRLAQAIGRSDYGELYVAPMPVRLGAGKMREPDVVFFRTEHLDRIHEQFTDPPDLVIEVLSPSTRSVDLGEKLVEYAEAGIPEYWVVDLEAGAIAAYKLAGNRYAAPTHFGPGVALSPSAAPDVTVEVDGIVAYS